MENWVKRIAAKVIRTGRIVEVEDYPIWCGFFRCYNPHHLGADGRVYHDRELEFLESRLQ